MKYAIASTALCAIGSTAAFTAHPRISAGLTLVPRGKLDNSVRRSMVAMEPEKAQHQNAKNKLKPQTSIMKPEELIKEMEEANGFSEWQGAFNGGDSNSNIPKEEMLGTEDAHVSVDIEAIVREVEETLDADNGDTVDEVEMAERDKATEVVPAEKEVEDSAAVPNLMEGATEAEDDTTKKTSIAMPVQNVAENVAKLNFLFRVMNRAMVSKYIREIIYCYAKVAHLIHVYFHSPLFLEGKSKRMYQRTQSKEHGYQELLFL
jgi:hypothetical protein